MAEQTFDNNILAKAPCSCGGERIYKELPFKGKTKVGCAGEYVVTCNRCKTWHESWVLPTTV